MTFAQFLLILRARGGLIVTVFAACVLAALAFALTVPRQYTSAARVLVEQPGSEKSPAMAGSSGGVNNLVSTQRDLIASPAIAVKVVESMKLDENLEQTMRLLTVFNPVATVKEWLASLLPGRGSSEELSPKYWIADRLGRNLEVRATRDSQMLRIEFTSPNPRFSTDVTNAFARAYVDANTNIRANPAKEESERFDAQLAQMRTDLEKAEGKLSKFQQEKGIVASDEKLDLESQRLTELATQVAVAQSEAYAGEARRRQLRGFISGGGGEAPAEVASSPAVLQLRQAISEREGKLSDLSNRIGPNHPQYQAAQAEIKQLRNELARTQRSIATSQLSTSDVAGQREAALRGALEQQKARILKMKNDRERLGLLQRDVDNARKAYDEATQKRAQTQMELQVGRSNVAVVDEATLPLRPSFPNTTLTLALGGFLGLTFGIGLALAREAGERYVRSEADLVELLGVPMLAVLPPRLPGARSVREALSSNV